MTEHSLKKIIASDKNRKNGANPLTIRKMLQDLLHHERIEKIEVTQTSYSISELSKKLSISMEELIKFKTFINTYSPSKTACDGISYEIIRLYCNTKFR